MDFDDLDDAVGGRAFDIVVYGATGYSGCLLVEHLDAVFSREGAAPRNWAIAGRNKKSLEKIAENCKSNPGIQCIEHTKKELESLAEMTTVLINCVGPFFTYGQEVVEACLDAKTHYIDITGELVFIGRMIRRYHHKARENGVMIMQCCGHMSIPEDVCCAMLVEKLGPLKQFSLLQVELGISGGATTFASAFVQYEKMYNDELQFMTDPFSLGGDRECGLRESDEDPKEASEDPFFPGVWLSSGHSSPVSQRWLRRTNELFDQDIKRGVDALDFGKSIKIATRYGHSERKSAEMMAFAKEPSNALGLMKHAETMRKALQRGQMGAPGHGPSVEARAFGMSEMWAVAESEDGQFGHVHFTGPDCYEGTAIAAATCALTLLDEMDTANPKERGGIVSAGYAFYNCKFHERLNEHPYAMMEGRSFMFEFAEGKPKEEAVQKSIKSYEVKSDALNRKRVEGMEGLMERPKFLQ